VHEQPFPRPLKLFDQNDPLIERFWALVTTHDAINCLWILAMNQVAAAHVELSRLLPIGNPDPVRQKGVEFLRSRLELLRISPMELLLERLRVHLPELTDVVGRYLRENIATLMLRFLRHRIGRAPTKPFVWQGEYITGNNPIRVEAYSAEYINVTIPLNVSTRHHWELYSYIQSLRPAPRRGRPTKPPDAPRTRRPNITDAEAIRAWELHQHGADAVTIARTLFPGEPRTTEQDRRRVRQKVRRRLARGRVLTRPPTGPTSPKPPPL